MREPRTPDSRFDLADFPFEPHDVDVDDHDSGGHRPTPLTTSTNADRSAGRRLAMVLLACWVLTAACSSDPEPADRADTDPSATPADSGEPTEHPPNETGLTPTESEDPSADPPDETALTPTESEDPSEDAAVIAEDPSHDDIELAPVRYGELDAAMLAEMRNSTSNEPVFVISFLRFNEQADYADGRSTDLTGEAAYDLYGASGHREGVGGELVHSASISTTTTDSDGSRGVSDWHRVEIARYPSRSSYVQMFSNPEYQAAATHKDAGLETAIVMVAELTMSSTSDVLPLDSGPETIHLGELLQLTDPAAEVLYEKNVVADSIRFGLAVPVGDFSIEGVLVGDGRTWDEFRLSQFPSRAAYDEWEASDHRQNGLDHRVVGATDSEIVVTEPPTVRRLPEIPAAQPWRWFTMGSMDPEGRAALFSNWQLVTPVSTAEASPTPRAYPRALLDPDDISYEHEGIRRSIADYIDRASAAGLLAIHDGTVVLEHYGLGIDSDSRFHIWSASKSFTSTLVAIAAHEGKIASLDDPVSMYAPEFSDTAYGETSIRNLLMMASGIDFSHSGDPGRTDLYWDVVNQGQSIDDWTAALTRRVPGGTDFNYTLTDTHVLSAVLRAVYDMPFAEIVETKLWQPAGFASDATWGQNTSGSGGHALGHCCLSLTLQDFAHLGQLYLDDFVVSGEQMVPSDWVDAVAQPGVGANYSLQFWLPPGHDQEFIARGAFSNYLWTDTARGFTVAQFGTPPPRDALSTAEHAAAMRAIGDALTD